MSEARQICTFQVDGECFGIDVARVQEVLRFRRVTPVPLAPAVIGGLINIRGDICIAVDLARLLGVEPAPPHAEWITVITLPGQDHVGLLVDRSGEVIEVAPEDAERPPETVQGQARELVETVYKLDQGLLLTLDVDRIIARTEREVSEAVDACATD